MHETEKENTMQRKYNAPGVNSLISVQKSKLFANANTLPRRLRSMSAPTHAQTLCFNKRCLWCQLCLTHCWTSAGAAGNSCMDNMTLVFGDWTTDTARNKNPAKPFASVCPEVPQLVPTSCIRLRNLPMPFCRGRPCPSSL